MFIARVMAAFVFAVITCLTASQPVVAAGSSGVKLRPDKVVLIFVPGIFGSGLFNPTTQQWHWGHDDYGSRGLSLKEYPTFETSLLEKATVRVAGMKVKERNVYSDFREHGDWIVGDVFSFAYDWRKSNRMTAAEFDEWLCEVLPPRDDHARVVIVAHSMGGLVLRHWLKDYLELQTGCASATVEQIDQFVFAGTPHLGSLEPVESLVTGQSALTEEPFFSLLFSDNVVRDALTFESTYELLPAYNIIRPDCAAADTDLSRMVTFVSDTATPRALQLWNVRHWKRLGLPLKLPSGMGRDATLEMVETRLASAAETVCSLLTHEHPPEILQKMFFVTGSKEGRDGRSKIRDTLSELEFPVGVNASDPKPVMARGDGTVPSWSAYPSWRLGYRDYLPVSAYHDALLSESNVKLYIDTLIEYAARTAAIELGDMFTTRPTDQAALRTSLEDFAALDPALLDPSVYRLAVDQFHEAAAEAGVDGNELYDVANRYDGENRSAFRAITFSVAARDGVNLNADRMFWAKQNSAYAFYQLGAANYATGAAFEAAGVNIANFGAEENQPVRVPEKFFNQDAKWRSVAARGLEQLGYEAAAEAVSSGPIPTSYEMELTINGLRRQSAITLP